MLAGSATSTRKLTVPTASTVAAKCTLRTRVSGSVTALLNSLIGAEAYGPTRKMKSPCVRWASTERTRQITL